MGEAGVLVVFGARRGGSRAIVAALAFGEPLAVVAIAPRREPRGRCTVYTGALEEAIADAAARDLRDAQAILSERAAETTFVLLAPADDRDIAAWALRAGLRRAVVASRRLGRTDPIARELARAGIKVSVAR